MSITIRSFEKKDQDAVRHLVLEGLAERWGSEFDASYNQDVNDIDGYYVQHHHATVAVLENKQDSCIYGCGILLPLPAEDRYGTWCAEPPSSSTALSEDGSKKLKLCRMMRLSVSKELRGKGYAKKIINHLRDAAQKQHFDRILVETETAWTSAVQVYKSAGFRVVEAGEENVHFEYDVGTERQ
ncbi:hypothetical protein EDD11_000105 [Mortierella claussenii]|nr:hypothetical protein EDD11_000105 [Mortierella claussenii]